jgi:hypothetical protein
MSKTPTEPDPASWHRHFAAQANNRAWDLAESRTDASRDAQMLAAAHAAAWHWDAVGTELHRMRAMMLLALVNALAGHGATAWQQAETVHTFLLGQSETPDWERAFVHATHLPPLRRGGVMHTVHPGNRRDFRSRPLPTTKTAPSSSRPGLRYRRPLRACETSLHPRSFAPLLS